MAVVNGLQAVPLGFHTQEIFLFFERKENDADERRVVFFSFFKFVLLSFLSDGKRVFRKVTVVTVR